MEFVLFKKLAGLEGTELIMLIVAAVVLAALIVFVAVRSAKNKKNGTAVGPRRTPTRIIVEGALCLAMAFVLSYIKLFSMPLGGSITLCSMLPIVVFGYMYGPAYGFTLAFAYSLLQIIQGAWIVHPVQFILDYFVAFTVLGLGSLFPKSLPLGMAVSGVARMSCSVISGVVFFASSAAEAGYSNALLYSFVYNGSTIGVDTVMCVIVAALPPVARAVERIKKT